MNAILYSQYGWVKDSRAVLFEYCAKLSAEDFVAENSSYGRGSIRNLLVHIANAYEFWIGRQALKNELTFTSYASVRTVQETTTMFLQIDALVNEFLHVNGDKPFAEISVMINGKAQILSPLKLISHVITHEYHHKGQILSLSRHLGYTPVDTDLIR